MVYDDFIHKIASAEFLADAVGGDYKYEISSTSFTITMKFRNSLFFFFDRQLRDELVYLLHESKFFNFQNEKLKVYYKKDLVPGNDVPT